jgi:uncharacterized protein
MHEALETICVKTGMSSAHVTFPRRAEWLALGERGYLQRTGIQYHWENRGYATFDQFLASLRQSRRKRIRQEPTKSLHATHHC